MYLQKFLEHLTEYTKSFYRELLNLCTGSCNKPVRNKQKRLYSQYRHSKIYFSSRKQPTPTTCMSCGCHLTCFIIEIINSNYSSSLISMCGIYDFFKDSLVIMTFGTNLIRLSKVILQNDPNFYPIFALWAGFLISSALHISIITELITSPLFSLVQNNSV